MQHFLFSSDQTNNSISSIPLIDVVECGSFSVTLSFISLTCFSAYNVYHTGQGVQGLQKTPSKQQLDTIFGTHNEVDVVESILKNGRPQHGDIESNVYINSSGKGVPALNVSRGSGVVDNRGKGLSGI